MEVERGESFISSAPYAMVVPSRRTRFSRRVRDRRAPFIGLVRIVTDRRDAGNPSGRALSGSPRTMRTTPEKNLPLLALVLVVAACGREAVMVPPAPPGPPVDLVIGEPTPPPAPVAKPVPPPRPLPVVAPSDPERESETRGRAAAEGVGRADRPGARVHRRAPEGPRGA